MRTLAEWYPGDEIVFACAGVLSMVTILIAMARGVDAALAGRRAAFRSAVWLAALIGVALTPILLMTGRLLPWHRPTLSAAAAAPERTSTLEDIPPPMKPPVEAELTPRIPTADRQPVAISPAPPVVRASPPSHARPTLPPLGRPTPPTAPIPSTSETDDYPLAAPGDMSPFRALATGFLAIWAAGSVYLGARLVHGGVRVRQLRQRARPIDADLYAEGLAMAARSPGADRLPGVYLSPDVKGPVVAGLFPPRVLLPADLPGRCTPYQLRNILVHECAHIVRGDPWVRVLQQLAAALFWVHPLVHMLNRCLDLAREDVCDNYVLARTEPTDYAETLLTVAQLSHPVSQLEGSLAMLPRHHNLEHRVVSLLRCDREQSTRLSPAQRAAIVIGLGLVLLAVPVAGLRPAAADEKSGPPPAPAKDPAPTAEQPEAAAGTVTGRVVDAAGRPVAGADVRLRPADAHLIPYPTRRVATDANGGYTFAGVPPGKYRLWALADNSASRARMFEAELVIVPLTGKATPADLRMRPGVSLRVKVLSQAGGLPIPAARVRLTWTDTDRDHLTDARGEVELKALTPETWTVEAGAKGYAAVVQVVNLTDGRPAAVEVRLPPGGSAEGYVRDESGKALAGVGISAFRIGFEGGQLEYVVTGADGRYQFDYLPLGSLQFSLSKRDHLRETVPFSLNAAGGKPTRLDVTLKPRPHGGSVRGMVTDSKGRPVAGAELTNEGASSADVRQAKADAKGVFLLDDVYEGTTGHAFTVRAKGFAPQQVTFKPGPKDRPAVADVTLDPGHRLAGRVVDQAGKPVRGVHIFFAGGNSFPKGVGGYGTTDADGRFRFDSLPAAATFTFEAKGYSQIDNRSLPLDGADEVVVTLQVQGVIKGQVVDAATGKPVPRFTVSITFTPDRQPDDPTAWLPATLTDPGQTFARPDGRFELGELVAGMPLQVSVTAEGYRRQVLRRVVAESAAKAAVEIKLRPEDPAKLLTVRGKLLDHRGKAVPGAELRLVAAADRPADREAFPFNWAMIESGQLAQNATVLQFQKKTTAADGGFEFRNVPDGVDVELVYWGKGVPPARLDRIDQMPAAERTGLTIRAQAPARVVGTIDRTAFPKVDNIQLSGSLRFYPAVIAADGKSFVVEDVPAGEYEVQVYGPAVSVEGRPAAITQPVLGRQKITLTAGKEEPVGLGPDDLTKE